MKLTKEKLLAGTVVLDSVPTITNEVVLDLFHFMNRSPECTYHTLTQWLSSLCGERCPKEEFPTVKAIRQSVLRLYARLSRLKKSKTESRDQNVATFLKEEYCLPSVFVVHNKVHKPSSEVMQPGFSNDEVQPGISDGDEVLQAVNVDLCRELTKLQLENQSLKATEDQLKKTRQKMYSLHRNTTKKLQRREKVITTQAKDISEKKKAVEHLQHKVSHLEPQVEQLQQDKDRIRHRAKYWQQRCDELKAVH